MGQIRDNFAQTSAASPGFGRFSQVMGLLGSVVFVALAVLLFAQGDVLPGIFLLLIAAMAIATFLLYRRAGADNARSE